MKIVIYIIIFLVLIIGILFRIMHWPHSGIMLTVSLTAIAVALLKIAYDLRQSLFSILPVLFSITVIEVLFKIQHWPFPDYVTNISRLSFSVLLPILFIRRSLLFKKDNAKLSSHFFFIGLLLGIFAVELVIIQFTPTISILSGFAGIILLIFNVLLLLGIIVMIIKTLLIKNLKKQHRPDHSILKFLLLVFTITVLVIPVPLIYGIQHNITEESYLITDKSVKDSFIYQTDKTDLYNKLEFIEHPDKEKIISKANILKEKVIELSAYIEDLKVSVINESGGKDESGNIKNMNDFNASTQIMIEQGKGFKLQQKINSIRDVIFQLIKEEDKLTFKENLSLKAEDPKDNEIYQTWPEWNFKKVPVIAAVTILTKIHSDLTKSEAYVLNYVSEKYYMTEVDN